MNNKYIKYWVSIIPMPIIWLVLMFVNWKNDDKLLSLIINTAIYSVFAFIYIYRILSS